MAVKCYDVLCIGNPFRDRAAFVSEDFLKKHNLTEGSTVPTESKIEVEKEWKDLNPEQKNSHMTFGGSCFNVTKVLARMGNHCGQCGKNGNDEYGDDVEIYLKKLGIVSLLTKGKRETGVVNCYITPNDRTMKTFFGASIEFSEKDVLEEQFEHMKLVHNEGYSIFFGDTLKKSINSAQKHGAKSSLDLASDNIVKDFKSKFEDCVYKVDYLFGNRKEIEALTGTSDPKEAFEKFNIKQTVVMTEGVNGCWVKDENGKIEHFDAQKVEKVIDPTGAGDFFCGGFLDGTLKNQSIAKRVEKGNLLASTVIQHIGAELPETKWSDILNLASKI